MEASTESTTLACTFSQHGLSLGGLFNRPALGPFYFELSFQRDLKAKPGALEVLQLMLVLLHLPKGCALEVFDDLVIQGLLQLGRATCSHWQVTAST
eukprot:6264562-Amphidinium_carterae.2